MSAVPISTDEATSVLVARSCPILICDTCSFLDVIRLPARQARRGNALTVLSAAKNALRRAESDSLSLVIPSLVVTEWVKHAARTRDETAKHMLKVRADYEVIRAILGEQGGTLPSVSFASKGLANSLRNISTGLLNVSLVLDREDGPSLRAVTRSADGIAPSSKGNINDCLLHEHMLELLRKLNEKGFSERKVFLTSNKTDFMIGNRPKAPIDTELAGFSTVLCTAWDWALSQL